jgi:hypothetical protein
MKRSVVLPLLSLLPLVGACGAAAPGRCWVEVDGKIAGAAEVVRFTPIAEPAVGASGRAAAVLLDVDTASGPAVFRIYDPSGKPACVQLESVKDPGSGTSWVTPPAQREDYGPYCVSCPQRTAVAVGPGLYVLPSGDPQPQPARSLSIEAAVRDCSTFLPPLAEPPVSSLRVEKLVLLSPIDGRPASDRAEGVIPIEIAITRGSIFHDRREALPAELAAALEEVNAMLRPGFLTVRVARIRRAEGEDPLIVPRGDHAALERVRSELGVCEGSVDPVRADRVALVLAGCIKTEDPILIQAGEPDGFVPHIPDGWLPPERAQGIFIKGRGCALGGTQVEWAASNLARLIAHELGHSLGLYHSVEESGQSDPIADTAADNLMHFRPFSVATAAFTPGQFRVMRRHPVVRWDPP